MDAKLVEFLEHPKGSDTQSAWFYFLREKDGPHAKCKNCGKILMASGGTTSGLHTHLISIHNINLLKRRLPKTKGSSKIASGLDETSFLEKDSLPSAFARLTASDALSFNIISTSYDIREGLSARGFKDIPRCPKTIRKIVIEYSRSIRTQLTKKLSNLIKNGERFCLTLDERTSIRNRRYMNVNVHSSKEFWNLGLIRVRGSMPAEKGVELIKEKISKHGLSLEKHIIAITTDGASVMTKLGKLIEADQQLCFAHGIHLAVQDILYAKKVNECSSVEEEENDECIDGESMDEESLFEIDDESTTDTYEERHQIFSIIQKIRTVVKKLRRSPVKNDNILQKYIKEEFGPTKDYTLILDTKIRWNSLLAMVERFYTLRHCIQKSLIDLKSNIQFTESEFEVMSNLISILLPVKLTVDAICRQDASLLTADIAIKFMFQSLCENSSSLSNQFKASLKLRINQRRTDLSSLLQYLHNQYQSNEEDEGTLKKDKSRSQYFNEIFPKMNKNAIVKNIVTIIERLHKEQNADLSEALEPRRAVTEENEAESTNDATKPVFLKEKLQLAISKEIGEISSDEASKEKTPNSLMKIIKREILTFEELHIKGKYLRMVYNHLLAIRPSSVESERAFSAAGILCTKVRSRMGDETIDELCFLRAHFKVNKSKKKTKQ